jgi:hypothetical protein
MTKKYRYSCQFQSNFDFLDRFSKNSGISNFMKILSVGAELFHVYTDRQTDRQTEGRTDRQI